MCDGEGVWCVIVRVCGGEGVRVCDGEGVWCVRVCGV